jgi:hypothetical protein
LAPGRLITYLAAAVLLGSSTLVASLGRCAAAPRDRAKPGFEVVLVDGRRFELEVADDAASRERGLMFRESIPEDGGMLFVFPDAEFRSFWMANCLVDLDIIFLDRNGRVTAMHRMKAAPPRGENESELEYQNRMALTASYDSAYPAQFAIELRAGWLDRLELRVEDAINLDRPRLTRAAR